MLVVLWIMASIKGPHPVSKGSMDVFGLIDGLVFSHDDDIGLDEVFVEGGGLSHESEDHLFMALAKHGRYHIPLS